MQSKQCKKCFLLKPLTDFYWNKAHENFYSQCKKCHCKFKKEYDKKYGFKWRKTHPNYWKNNCKIGYNAIAAAELRLLCLKYYSNNVLECACCKENIIRFLTIDHINNDGNKHRKQIGRSKLYKWLVKSQYPKGFQVLCMNCNWGKAQNKNKGICPHKETQKAQ